MTVVRLFSYHLFQLILGNFLNLVFIIEILIFQSSIKHSLLCSRSLFSRSISANFECTICQIFIIFYKRNYNKIITYIKIEQSLHLYLLTSPYLVRKFILSLHRS